MPVFQQEDPYFLSMDCARQIIPLSGAEWRPARCIFPMYHLCSRKIYRNRPSPIGRANSTLVQPRGSRKISSGKAAARTMDLVDAFRA
jgi:hypothetical protein